VNVLESTLDKVLASPKFAKADQLRETVNSISSFKKTDARIAAYAALVGVDSRSAEDMAEFIGARDLGPYVAVAQENLDLSRDQAEILVNTLSKNLLNSLNGN
jgi:hypothetical protein